MHRSRLRIICLLLFIYVIFSARKWFNAEHQFSLHEHLYPHSDPSPAQTSKNPPPPILCQPNECSTGKWHFRSSNPTGSGPFTSLSQVQSVYSNLWHPVWDKCDVIYDPVTGNKLDEGSEEKKKLEGQRLVETLNWEWVPDRGLLLDYDPVDFVVRLLKSPGGLVLIGDSISRQHWHAIYYTFRHLNITFDSNPKHLPLAGRTNVEQFVLSKSSPMTKILQEKAGVPQSRMERPFFTLFEDHLVLNEQDILAITKKNTREGFRWDRKWRKADGWEEHLKWLTMPREGEEETVVEDTLLMINAGAHWSSHELYMLRAPTDAEEKAMVKDAYTGMIDLLMTRLSPLSRTSIYYRSTAPGHPQCNISRTDSELESETQIQPKANIQYKHSPTKFIFNTPYPNISFALSSELNLVERLQDTVSSDGAKNERARWDWDLFNVHNEIWRRRIEGINNHVVRERDGQQNRASIEQHGKGSRTGGAKWYYLNIWDMSLQRPDAHSEPGKDCLHWCLPSVFDEWTRLFYHRVKLEESQNQEELESLYRNRLFNSDDKDDDDDDWWLTK